eukprot:g12372.t1
MRSFEELVAAGFSWRWAFVGQAIAFGGSALLCVAYGGRRYLDFAEDEPVKHTESEDKVVSEVEYPSTEKWGVYEPKCKYVIRKYAMSRGFELHLILATFSGIALLGPALGGSVAMPSMFITFFAAGGVYPAAQGIINIALTSSRVIEASVYQVQCNNILFAMPMPYAIGKAMDSWSIGASFRLVALLQVVAATGFAVAVVAADFEEDQIEICFVKRNGY